MIISYQNKYLREYCSLLGSGDLNSPFSTIQTKSIRAVVEDLRASPKLTDCPIQFKRLDDSTIEIELGSIKIICDIISSLENPKNNEIERLKIIEILNIDLQQDLRQQNNNL